MKEQTIKLEIEMTEGEAHALRTLLVSAKDLNLDGMSLNDAAIMMGSAGWIDKMTVTMRIMEALNGPLVFDRGGK